MRVVLQRVREARVEVDGRTVGSIGRGLLIFLGVGRDDTEAAADQLAGKIARLRIFEDAGGRMNVSALEAGAQFLVVSQFTLYGDCRKGRRPSFDRAADQAAAGVLYEYFVGRLRCNNAVVETGRFAALMDVHLVNEGPVTFILES
jgi:D-tyrosyl-tRNA(Tyr) deacylase